LSTVGGTLRRRFSRRLSLTNLSSFTSGMDMLSSSVRLMGFLSRKKRSINLLNP
jgi:hypothetical protein